MAISGVSHVALTVTDVDRSAAWYSNILGWTEQTRGRDIGDFAYGVLPGGLPVVLRKHDNGSADAFSEFATGLDHLSLSVDSKDDLDAIESKLVAAGATYTPAKDLPWAWLLNFRDPDNIALEIVAGKS